MRMYPLLLKEHPPGYGYDYNLHLHYLIAKNENVMIITVVWMELLLRPTNLQFYTFLRTNYL